MKKYKQNVNGITLIALVVTIIVLLILAGITIQLLIGENGIITRARYASNLAETTRQEEEKAFQDLENEIEEFLKVTDSTPGDMDGDGTPEHPFVIASVEDLITFIDRTNTKELTQKNIELKSSLDITNDNSYVDPNTTQFGDYNGDGAVKGLKEELMDTNATGLKKIEDFDTLFNGNNHKISGIYEKITQYTKQAGFIEDLTGSIENLTLEGDIKVEIKEGAKYLRVGGIVGRNKGGKIKNCTNKMNISIHLSLKPESVTEQANHSMAIGGIVGNNEGLIQDCKNLADIHMDITEELVENHLFYWEIGGIAGKNQNQVVNASNFGNIYITKQSTGTREKEPSPIDVGGIVGSNVGSMEGNCVKNAINRGNVHVVSVDSIHIGGIVSYNSSKSTIENVLNIGTLTSDTAKSVYQSGIVADGKNHISNAYNIGEIISNATNRRYFGAIVGNSHSTTILKDCYYKPQEGILGSQSLDVEGVTRMESLTEQVAINYLNDNVNKHNSSISNNEIPWTLWK